jgi:superfamily I DNA/RNA helicase
VIAAITFTIKAAQEIKDRIKIDVNRHFIGTNNSFAIEEIIKPFIKDVYGSEYNIELNTDYSCKISSFDEGISKIKGEALLCSYTDNDKNFIFELAYNILNLSKSCRLYLKSKYYKIYIDEYQDCDRDMHKLFMYICETLGISTFIVGDEKQSIYMWRGAYPKAFKDLWGNTNFKHLILSENYRSCKQIQNYSNILVENTRYLYNSVAVEGAIKLVVCESNNIIQKITENVDLTKKFALLRFSNFNAKRYANLLKTNGVECVYIPQIPILDITTKSAWLYIAIAKYIVIKNYSVYDFYNDIPSESDNEKYKINEFERQLKAIELKKLDKSALYILVQKLATTLGYEVKRTHIDKLYDTLNNIEYHVAFEIEKQKNIAITFHSSKGLEYEQVIVFAEDYSLEDEQAIYNHYVAVTRAKSKLIIVYQKNNVRDKLYADNLNAILKSIEIEFKDIVDIIK